MRITPEIRVAIRAALAQKPMSTTVEVSAIIGCKMRESYEPLRKMVEEGLIDRELISIEGKRSAWVYFNCTTPMREPTPPPYPNVLMVGEWRSDMFSLMNLNRR